MEGEFSLTQAAELFHPAFRSKEPVFRLVISLNDAMGLIRLSSLDLYELCAASRRKLQ
jgi:hypothetical protein